jgi:hypothetical protein
LLEEDDELGGEMEEGYNSTPSGSFFVLRRGEYMETTAPVLPSELLS